MEFKSFSKYFDYIKKQMKKILEEIAVETRQELYDAVLKKLYEAYTPTQYKRTEELLNSISKTEVKENSNGEYYVIIYYDTDKIFPHVYTDGRPNAHATSKGVDISNEIPYIVEYEYSYGQYKNNNGIHATDDVQKWIEIEFNKLFKQKLLKRGIKTTK